MALIKVPGSMLTPDVAGSIPYSQGGVGAVGRTVEARLRDITSVKDFGAVGDGVTDDTIALQKALDSGQWVRVPLGRYRTTATLQYASGGGLVGDSSFFWQLASNAPPVGQAAEIYYDGAAGSNTCVVNMSLAAVGTLPVYAADESQTLRNACIKGVVINGNAKAEFGLYSARAGLGNVYENVIVTGTKKRGFFFGEFWTCEVSNLLAIHNYGTGGSIGEDLFSWGTGNIVNAVQFNSLQAFKNGRDALYNESSAPKEGVGWIINVNRTCVFTNLIAELNYGAGLYISPRTGPNLFKGVYLEDNCHFDPVADAASTTGTAYASGAASAPWGIVGYNRKTSADTIQTIFEGVLGAAPGSPVRYQHIKLTGDASGGFVQEPAEPWVFRGVYGIHEVDSDFYNYSLDNVQSSLIGSGGNNEIVRCLPKAGIPESVTGTVTTLYVGNAAAGNKSGRTSAANAMLLADAIECARVCKGVTTIDVSAMTSTGSPATSKTLDGRGFTRRLTISGGAAGRFNYATGDNVAATIANWSPKLTITGMAVLDRLIINDSTVALTDCPIVRTGANNDARAGIVCDNSTVEVNGTTTINVSNSTAGTKIGISLAGNSEVSFNDAAAGTVASYTGAHAIDFNRGSGTVRVSLTTATAAWAAAAAVTRNTGGSGGMILAPNGLNP